MRALLPSLLSAVSLVACGGSGDGPARPDLGIDAAGADAGADDGDDAAPVDSGTAPDACVTLSLAPVVAGLDSPSCAIAPPGDDRLFVCERMGGRVRILDATGTPATTPFLDVSSQLSTAGFEMGLLALAFHPDFATHPRVFASYTTSTSLRIVSFDAPSSTATTVTAASEQTLLEVPLLDVTPRQRTAGSLAFGPDGFLYVGIGDMDTQATSQDLNDLHGKLLRLDVDQAGMPYAIPPTNPFVGMAGHRAEIWAYGFREPYRISFDAAGELFVGEVGDSAFEEVDVLAPGAGGNYGWPITEGNGHCHTPHTGCVTTGLVPPVYEYAHGPLSDAIMGGYVYAGTALPACWHGRYFFGDYAAVFLASFAWDGTTASDARHQTELHPSQPVSLGLDGHGEVLVIGYDGSIVRIAPP